MVSYYLELVDYLGGDVGDRRLRLYVDKQARASLHELLAGRGYDPARPTIVFIPGAKFGASKCWPPRYFAQLADQLLEARPANLVVISAPGEEAIGEAIEQLSPRGVIHLWRDPIGLGRLKALVAESHLVVTNDTGPRHVAAAFDVPVVTIFGPTDPRWTDTGHKKEVALAMTGLDCLPCQLPVCPRKHECLEQLLPEQVFQAATDLLGRYPPKPAAAARRPAEQAGGSADPAGRSPTAP
jgi:heptosyltransferase-2